MMLVQTHVREALGRALERVLGDRGDVPLERPQSDEHGDLATSVALKRAPEAGLKPRALAEELVDTLNLDSDYVDKVEIAGPGFINFFFAPPYMFSLARGVAQEGTAGLWPRHGDGLRAQVEFCSANPTGPLLVSHGRGLVLGDALANILGAAGYDVTREYYYNDAGRQMRLLGESVRARCQELLGEQVEFPADGYQGAYITKLAEELLEESGGAVAPPVPDCTARAEATVFEWIKATVARLGVTFDVFFNEASLHRDGRVAALLDVLEQKGLTYDKDGARWFKGGLSGLGADRVLVKASGEPTYRLPDLAYHIDKLGRGFDLVVDVLGTDHLEESQDVLAGLRALGEEADRIRVVIHQFVTLLRGGRRVKMSTRKAVFVTLDDLIEEVGSDVVRFFFLMRSAGSHLIFDLDLAKKESDENPVFYLQYAHARMAGVLRHAEELQRPIDPANASFELLIEPEERQVLRAIARYPDVADDLVRSLEPHRLVSYLLDLASAFHLFYHRHRIIGDDRELSSARLALMLAVRRLLREGLGVLGVTAPERM